MIEQEKIDAVTAALNGHDPNDWFNPEPSVIPGPGGEWIIIKKDSHLIYFASEKDAWRFKYTGVMP